MKAVVERAFGAAYEVVGEEVADEDLWIVGVPIRARGEQEAREDAARYVQALGLLCAEVEAYDATIARAREPGVRDQVFCLWRVPGGARCREVNGHAGPCG